MALLANVDGHNEAMRLAQTTQLFGMQKRLLKRLHEGDYRGALLLCRRALTCEEEGAHAQQDEKDSPEDYRAPLLHLVAVVNRLRLEMRSR